MQGELGGRTGEGYRLGVWQGGALHPGARAPEELQSWGHGRVGWPRGCIWWQLSPNLMPQTQPLRLRPHALHVMCHAEPGEVAIHSRRC